MACTEPLPLSAAAAAAAPTATFKMNNLFSIFCPTKEIAFHRSSDYVVEHNKNGNMDDGDGYGHGSRTFFPFKKPVVVL